MCKIIFLLLKNGKVCQYFEYDFNEIFSVANFVTKSKTFIFQNFYYMNELRCSYIDDWDEILLVSKVYIEKQNLWCLDLNWNLFSMYLYICSFFCILNKEDEEKKFQLDSINYKAFSKHSSMQRYDCMWLCSFMYYYLYTGWSIYVEYMIFNYQ